MSTGWLVAIALCVVFAVSVLVLVYASSERRRIRHVRRRCGLDRPLDAARVDEATRRLRP